MTSTVSTRETWFLPAKLEFQAVAEIRIWQQVASVEDSDRRCPTQSHRFVEQGKLLTLGLRTMREVATAKLKHSQLLIESAKVSVMRPKNEPFFRL
jgi:hypothetical protein